jgi:hypothetical protein
VTKALARYGLLVVAVGVFGGLLLSLAFRGPGERPAVWISAGFAVLLQLAAFLVARLAGKAGITARMGAGMLVRFLGLVGYALVVALALKLPPVAALISLAALLFASSLLEPLLIRT